MKIFIFLWLICAFFSFGAFNAYDKCEFSATYNVDDYARDMGLSLVEGPFGFLICPFLTGFFRHGFDWSL